MKPTIAHIILCGSDFWTAVTHQEKTTVTGFFYSDEADKGAVKTSLFNTVKTLDPNATQKETDLTHAFLHLDPAFQIKSPSTGKIYEEECEGDCLRSLLEAEGHQVLKAFNALEAFEATKTQEVPAPA